MLSNQKLQNSLDEIKDISRMESALFTSKGKLVAHTEAFPITDTLERVVMDITNSMAESQIYQDYHLYKIMVEGEMDLGEFGRIHFIDWDQTRARQRTVQVMVIGE